MAKTLNRPAFLLAAVIPLLAHSALGQRVQFPTKLPPSTPIRVASGPVVAPPAALTDETKTGKPAPTPPESYASSRSDQSQDDAYTRKSSAVASQVNAAPPRVVTQGPEFYVESPGTLMTEPCYPCVPGIPCCPPPSCPEYCWQVFGDFLWLDPRNAEVVYAIPINGAIVPPDGVAPVQTGPAAIVDPSRGIGFRAGLSRSLGSGSRVGASYMHLRSGTSHAIAVTPPEVLKALVVHPGFEAGDTNYLAANAHLDIDLDMIDLDYRGMLACDQQTTLEYLLGLRLASLRQALQANFDNGVRIERVATEIDFEGIGVRAGVEGERRSECYGWMVYGRASAGLLCGRFDADYLPTDLFAGTVANTGWDADRLVPTLDAEFGVGWIGPRDHCRLSAGYMFAAWYNVAMNGEFIDAVRTNRFSGMRDTLIFDGLVGRAEFRF